MNLHVRDSDAGLLRSSAQRHGPVLADLVGGGCGQARRHGEDQISHDARPSLASPQPLHDVFRPERLRHRVAQLLEARRVERRVEQLVHRVPADVHALVRHDRGDARRREGVQPRHTQRVGADDAAQRRDRRVRVAAVVVRVRHDGVAPAPLAGPERRAIEPLLAGD